MGKQSIRAGCFLRDTLSILRCLLHDTLQMISLPARRSQQYLYVQLSQTDILEVAKRRYDERASCGITNEFKLYVTAKLTLVKHKHNAPRDRQESWLG